MPQFDQVLYPHQFNSLHQLGYDEYSDLQLCVVSLATDLRVPLFADLKLARRILSHLLDYDSADMRVNAFTLLPDSLHFLAGVRRPETHLDGLISHFKTLTTQRYRERGKEIVESRHVVQPSVSALAADHAPEVTASLMDWRATLLPEFALWDGWPAVQPEQFRKRRLWQTRRFDRVIRNDIDLQENVEFIVMSSVREGYVTHPQFYPFTGFVV
jgi:hypothetical protein